MGYMGVALTLPQIESGASGGDKQTRRTQYRSRAAAGFSERVLGCCADHTHQTKSDDSEGPPYPYCGRYCRVTLIDIPVAMTAGASSSE